MRQLHEIAMTRRTVQMTTTKRVILRTKEVSVVVEAVQDGGHMHLRILEPVDVVIRCSGHRSLGKARYTMWPKDDVRVERVS